MMGRNSMVIVLFGIIALLCMGLAVTTKATPDPISYSLSSVPPSAARFAISQIDPAAPQAGLDTGRYTSLAFTSSGVPKISYYDATNQDLRMASPASSGGNCGPGNTWSCQAIDSTGDVGKYSSIAVYEGALLSGTTGIAYYDDTNNALKYAHLSCLPLPCSWEIETVDDTPFEDGLGLSLKFDAQGNPHIAYYTRGQVGSLNYASYVGSGGNCGDGNSWQCEMVEYGGGDAGLEPSLALNADGLPRIAYARYDTDSGPGKYNLWFASYSATPIQDGGCTPDSAHWSCLRISTDTSEEGHHISLAIAPDPINGQETAHVVSYSITNEQVYYARNNYSSYTNCGQNSYDVFTWTCMQLAGLGSVPATQDFGVAAISTDPQNYPVIAYTGDYSGAISLSIARPIEALGLQLGNCGPEVLTPYPHHLWQCTELDPGVAEQVGEGLFPSVAVRSTGRVGISYWEFDGNNLAGTLKFADQRWPIFLPSVVR